jgi:hypothetical protein
MAIRLGGYEEAAPILGTKSPATVRNWLRGSKHQRLPGLEKAVVRIGCNVRFDLDLLEQLVRDNVFARPLRFRGRKSRARKGSKK